MKFVLYSRNTRISLDGGKSIYPIECQRPKNASGSYFVIDTIRYDEPRNNIFSSHIVGAKNWLNL